MSEARIGSGRTVLVLDAPRSPSRYAEAVLATLFAQLHAVLGRVPAQPGDV